MPKKSGFTLIELLVVVSIITTLAVVGLVSFQVVRGRANEAKYKADVDAIKKAFEKNFDPSLNNGQGGYKPVTGNDFAGGTIPKDKDGNSYIITPPANIVDGSVSNYLACINPTTGVACLKPDSACICAPSQQGAGPQFSSLTNSSCDPYGVLGNGLVGYWKMNEGVGATALTDSSDNNITLTFGTGTAQPVWETATDTVSEKVASGYRFNGNDSIATATLADTAAKLNIPGKNISYGAWIHMKGFPTAADQYGTVLKTGGNPIGYRLLISSAQKALPQMGSQGNAVSTQNITLNTWKHLFVTYDGSKMKTYVDGVVDKEVAATGNIGNYQIPFTLGKTGDYKAINGIMYDVRVYTRALYPVEVNAIYSGCMS